MSADRSFLDTNCLGNAISKELENKCQLVKARYCSPINFNTELKSYITNKKQNVCNEPWVTGSFILNQVRLFDRNDIRIFNSIFEKNFNTHEECSIFITSIFKHMHNRKSWDTFLSDIKDESLQDNFKNKTNDLIQFFKQKLKATIATKSGGGKLETNAILDSNSATLYIFDSNMPSRHDIVNIIPLQQLKSKSVYKCNISKQHDVLIINVSLKKKLTFFVNLKSKKKGGLNLDPDTDGYAGQLSAPQVMVECSSCLAELATGLAE